MIMKNSSYKRLNLPYKGDRNYVHGTDLFIALVQMVDATSSMSMTIYHLSKVPVVAQLVDRTELGRLRKSGELNAVFAWNDAENCQHLVAVTNDPEDYECKRIDYDEAMVVDGFDIIGRQIQQTIPTPWSFIERTVSLNKQLLRDWTGEADWLFTRLDIAQLPKQAISLVLEVESDRDARLLKSIVVVDNVNVGSIYFSRLHA